MLLENAVVRAAAQVADRHVALGWRGWRAARALNRFCRRLRQGSARLVTLLPRLVDSSALGTGHRLSHISQKLFQARHRRSAKLRPGDSHVHVEVCRSIDQFGFVLLGPLRGTHQAFFLTVPTAKNHGALRLPSRFQQLADSVYRLQHRGRSAVRIDRAIDPRIAMVARNHPLARQLAATHAADHIPQSAELIILLEVHLHPYRSRPNVIGKGQRPLPLPRRIRPSQMLQNGRGIVVGEWRDRNLRHLRGLLWRNALVPRQRRQRRKARRRGVARKLEHVPDRSALHTGIRPPRPIRIFISSPPAIVERIGVDNHSRRAMLLRNEFLHAAEVLAVAHQHDLAPHIDLQLLQLLEILRRAVVRINHLRLDIP